MTNDFSRNDQDSRRYQHLIPLLYQCAFPGHTDLTYFAAGTTEQLQHLGDLKLTLHKQVWRIEEKLIRQKWDALFYETESCSKAGIVTDGWGRSCQAHYLNYMYEIAEIGLDCYLFRFEHFKQWFWSEMKRNPCQFKARRNPDRNESQGRLVPLQRCVRAGIPMRRYLLRFNGECLSLDLNEDVAA